MQLRRPTTKTYKRSFVIGAFSVGAIVVLGLWAVQMHVMIKQMSFDTFTATAEATRAQIEEGTVFAEELQPIGSVPIPDVLRQFQEAAENELQKELMTQEATAAMIDELETNQELDQTYAEEE